MLLEFHSLLGNHREEMKVEFKSEAIPGFTMSNLDVSSPFKPAGLISLAKYS